MNERIKKLRKALHLSQTEFAKKLGMTLRGVQKWEAGNVVIRESSLMLLENIFNVDLNWIRTGNGEMFKTPKVKPSNISKVTIAGERAVCVRYFPEIKASAGFGTFATDETYEDVCLDVSFVRDQKSDVIINVEGDSMSPLLLNKDKILVNTDVLTLRKLVPGRIYVLRIGDAIVIKRYVKRRGPVCIFRGDNPDFPEIKADLSDEQNQIVGIPRSVIFRMLQVDLEDEDTSE